MRAWFAWLAGAILCAALLIGAPLAARPTNIAATLLAEGRAPPGGTVTLAIRMQPAAGWHGYWQNPGDAGQGMTLDWTLPRGAAVGKLAYPVPETLVIAGLMNHVYNHDYAVLLPFTVPADARAGDVLPVRAKAQWLACTDTICVPEAGELQTTIRVGTAGAPDPQFDAWRAALPAPLGSPARFAFADGRLRIAIPMPDSQRVSDPHLFLIDENVVDYAAVQTYSAAPDLLIAEVPVAKFDPRQPDTIRALLRLNAEGDGVIVTATPGPVSDAGMPVRQPDPAVPPLGLLLLAALAGGLLLNVMPCVFPILSLKAISLARAGGSAGEARVEGLAYTSGVVVACLALGALLLVLRSAGQEVGWAFQLQEPLVVAALLLLAATITANLLGLFEFAVPGFAQHGSPQGAFATGLLAAFVATPCTGPFMAAAMGAALLLPWQPALLLFAALGLGIALPFLAIAFVPALRRRLPQPGPWMTAFRRWMALPMALTALALAWLAWRIGGGMFALAVIATTVAALALLAVVGMAQRRGHPVSLGLVFAIFAVTALGGAVAAQVVRDPAAVGDPGILDAQPFSEAALSAARAQGKPVFVYFTADWCLTCKINEKVGIDREATRSAFERAGVIVLRGDWTRRDPAITRFLTAQGAAGVPLYLWYPSGGGAPQQLSQVLTPTTLPDLAAGR